MKKDIKEILFWIFLLIGIALLIWNVFGNSPTELITLSTLIFTLLLKVWSISDRQIKSEVKTNRLERSFMKLVKDFKEHKHKKN